LTQDFLVVKCSGAVGKLAGVVPKRCLRAVLVMTPARRAEDLLLEPLQVPVAGPE